MQNSLNLKLNYYFPILALIIFFPRGVGFSILGSVIDLNEILHMLMVVLLLSKIKINIEKDGFLILLLILPVFVAPFSQFPQQAFINFVLNFFLYSLAYFIGKHFILNYRSASLSINFVKTIAVINTFCIVIALLNHFFQIVNFDIFRVYDESILNTTKNLQRVIDDVIGFSAFRGGLMASNHFAFFQISVLAFLITWLNINHTCLSKNLLLLFSFSILISVFSIVLSQSRGVVLLMALLIMLIFLVSIAYKRVWMSFYNPLIMLFFISATTAAFFYEEVYFLIVNISTIVNYIGMSGVDGTVVNTLDSSNRVTALLFIDDIMFSYPLAIFIGLGIGFWKYFPDDQVTYFADSPLIISMALEYGFVIFFILTLLIAKCIVRLIASKNYYKFMPYTVSFLFLLLALQISSAKDLYWLLFFLLGIVYNINTKNTYK